MDRKRHDSSGLGTARIVGCGFPPHEPYMDHVTLVQAWDKACKPKNANIDIKEQTKKDNLTLTRAPMSWTHME